jgi:hypothetical protein
MSEGTPPAEVTYYTAVRNFDHQQLADLPAYARLRQALSDLLNEAEARDLDLHLSDCLAATET